MKQHIPRSLTGSRRALAFTGFSFLTVTLSHGAGIIASDGESSELFGGAVSLSGDLGITGAYGDSSSGLSAGSAYVHRGLDTVTGTAVPEDAKLVASDADAFDNFGYSVSLSGSSGMVGSAQDDDGGLGSGSAYLFRGLGTATGTVNESVKLAASDRAGNDAFGFSVSISGNAGLVGAIGDDDNGSDSGSVYRLRFRISLPESGHGGGSVGGRACDGGCEAGGLRRG